ncbi:hypothetical protein GOV10_01940, partial [Candidatus Woesearchaeota archaeon]|nr:hypothetical protein [Candidatus Woesearchaeota archaeon]
MIDILPSLGLQDDECQYVIDDLLEEREEMGLPPAKDFEVYIGLNTYPAPAAVDR